MVFKRDPKREPKSPTWAPTAIPKGCSKKTSNKVYDLKIQTKYTKENLIKNKKAETTTYLLSNEINFYVTNNEIKI